MSKKNIIPIFVPHLGCPNDCVFCNQNKITSCSTNVKVKDVENTIKEYLGYFKQKDNVEIAFYGGSFTAIDINIQKLLLGIAKKYKTQGLVQKIRLSTRPDCVDENILNTLKEYNVDIIELGVQSLDENVLKLSNRGHDSASVYRAVNLIKKFNFIFGLQQMLGLPGDSINSSILTANEFIKLKPQFVRIYPTLVIKDTQLEKDLINGFYKPLSLENAVEISKEILKLYMLNDIYVIRIGLQPTENIQLGYDVVAGPFHPSIRQLVEGELLFDVLSNFFDDKPLLKETLIIKSSNKNVSNLAGQNSKIKKRIVSKLGLSKLKLVGESIPDNILEIEFSGKKFIINIKDYLSWS